MTDIFSQEKRSKIMSAVASAGTSPELLVRRLLHSMGFRFRTHRQDLPGRPDIILPRYKTAIFVHGCFWHRHGCRRTTTPENNAEYWERKFLRNRARDARNLASLASLAWRIAIIWECSLKPKHISATIGTLVDWIIHSENSFISIGEDRTGQVELIHRLPGEV